MSTPNFSTIADQFYTLGGQYYADWQTLQGNPTQAQIKSIISEMSADQNTLNALWVSLRQIAPTLPPEQAAALTSLDDNIHNVLYSMNRVMGELQNGDITDAKDNISDNPGGTDAYMVSCFRGAVQYGAAQINDLYNAWLASPTQQSIVPLLPAIENYFGYLQGFGGSSATDADRAGALGISLSTFRGLITQLTNLDGNFIGIQTAGGNGPPSVVAAAKANWAAALQTIQGLTPPAMEKENT